MENNQYCQNLYVSNSIGFDKNIVNNTLIILKLYMRRHQTRKQLGKLSAEQLRDVGISVDQALVESKKSFWE